MFLVKPILQKIIRIFNYWPLLVFRRASKAGEVEAITHTLAKYIMELSLTDYSLVAEPPSRLAASSLALAVRILDPGQR